MFVSDFIAALQVWGPIVGPAMGVLIFYLWKDYKRENRLQTRIEKLEREQKEIILPMVTSYAELITRNTDVMGRLQVILSRCLRCEYQEARELAERLLAATKSPLESNESA